MLISRLLQAHHSFSVGPVINRNFPDPCIAQSASGEWFAFSTQSGKINVQVASSIDLEHWTFEEGCDTLPALPPWTVPHPYAKVWAPDVNPLPKGTGFMVYFAAVGRQHPKKHCIGTATSPDIRGPYIPDSKPLICDLPRGGNIDPNLFRDPVNQKYYLVYKTDGNAIGHGGACGNSRPKVAPTPVYLQQLSPDDLTTKIGDPIFLASNVNPAGSFYFDGPNTGRPSIAFRNETYFFMYNAQCYVELKYRIDYMSCVVGIDTHTGIDECHWASLKAVQQRTKIRKLLKTYDMVSGTKLHVPGSMDTTAHSHPIWLGFEAKRCTANEQCMQQRLTMIEMVAIWSF